MKVKISEFLFNRFNQLENIGYELQWILGYCDRKIFKDEFYKDLRFATNLVELEISKELVKEISLIIKSSDDSDIEKAINILYMTLYVLGGTN